MATPIVSELYLACRNGDIATVQRLLPQTPRKILNRLEPNGSTCLHAASFNGHKEIVRLLLENGAFRRVINRYSFTPLDEAKTKEIVELFSRSTDEARKRFGDSSAQQTEWRFEDHVESFSRLMYWGCTKDRGIKRTVKKIQKAHVIDDNGEKSTEIVRDYLKDALDTNDPIFLLRAYTVESQFYRRLNNEMASGNNRQVLKKFRRKWTGYYTGMIMKNPAFEPYRFSGHTYRGMEITESDYKKYSSDIVLTNKSFQLTSKSWKIAKGLACPSNPTSGRLHVIFIFIIVDQRSALSIEQISEYQNEEEVLIVPGTLFIVTNINQDSEPYEIELKQLQLMDEF